MISRIAIPLTLGYLIGMASGFAPVPKTQVSSSASLHHLGSGAVTTTTTATTNVHHQSTTMHHSAAVSWSEYSPDDNATSRMMDLVVSVLTVLATALVNLLLDPSTPIVLASRSKKSKTNNKKGEVTKSKKGKAMSKENLPTKICVVCQRPFTWRKKWERCWDEVTCCSKACNAKRRSNYKAVA